MGTFLKYMIWLNTSFIPCLSLQAQTTNDYFLVPGPNYALPVGESTQLKVFWVDKNDVLRAGTEGVEQAPEWFLNGQPMTTAQDVTEGHLAASLDLSNATYTAPAEIPKTNPVTISVRFHPTDASKELITLVCSITIINPGNRWYVAFTYASFNYLSDNSGTDQHTDNIYAAGSSYMLIKGTPPDNGNVTINTDYDTIVSYNAMGNFSLKMTDISKDLNGVVVEKTIREHHGTIDHNERNGIEFEYDPSPDGIKQLGGAGLTFAEIGKDEFWNRNQNGQLVKVDSADINQHHVIVIGSSTDVVKKTKYGFTIDQTKKEDKSNTDAIGVKHEAHSSIEYHVVISRRPIK